MATVEELISQYEKDPELKREVDEILKDGRITPMEFLKFTKQHDLQLSIKELPEIIRIAKEEGLLK